MARGGTGLDTRRPIGLVRANIQQPIEPEPGGHEPGLACGAQPAQPRNPRPEFVGLNVESIDRLIKIRHDSPHQRANPCIPLPGSGPADELEKLTA